MKTILRSRLLTGRVEIRPGRSGDRGFRDRPSVESLQTWLCQQQGTRAGVKPSNDPEAIRVAQVRQLFSAGSYSHSGTGALIFFAWLEKNRPELLPKDRLGDPFQHLKVDLAGLLKD